MRTCHIVVPNQRNEVADAPPFEIIARKFAGNEGLLVANLMAPRKNELRPAQKPLTSQSTFAVLEDRRPKLARSKP
jgi:hypothetical protein